MSSPNPQKERPTEKNITVTKTCYTQEVTEIKESLTEDKPVTKKSSLTTKQKENPPGETLVTEESPSTSKQEPTVDKPTSKTKESPSEEKPESSPTQNKFKKFVDEPMGDKPVDKVPGIGVAYGKTLRDKHFDKAYMLLGKFLSIEKNETEFKAWLGTEVGANRANQKDCYEGLLAWYEKHP